MTMLICDGCGGDLRCVCPPKAMADAQTPVLADPRIAYIARWGGNCRDCADENGVCPNSGLPCGGADKAIRHVLSALDYGLKHGYLLAAQAPAQPSPTMADALAAGDGTLHGAVDHWQERALAGRAVMQQALDALQTMLSMQSEWHAAFPEHVGDKEAPAMQAARSAIAALSATMEKP